MIKRQHQQFEEIRFIYHHATDGFRITLRTVQGV